MIKLENGSYDEMYKLYLTRDFFFPLIAAVLLDEQDGVVYVNDPASPSEVYVEHALDFRRFSENPLRALSRNWSVTC